MSKITFKAVLGVCLDKYYGDFVIYDLPPEAKERLDALLEPSLETTATITIECAESEDKNGKVP